MNGETKVDYSESGQRQAFVSEIGSLLEQVQGNLNSIDNKISEINSILLPSQILKREGTCEEKKEGPQGWFRKTIDKLERLRDKSECIKDKLELLLNEVSTKK